MTTDHEDAGAFRRALRSARPDVVAHQKKNAHKRAIAIKLRDLRDARGMTQAEVARAAGMTQSEVARLEAPSGSLPTLATIDRYVTACHGEMEIVIRKEHMELPAAANGA
jgi:DNA-binding XRE family transcriptional regulator